MAQQKFRWREKDSELAKELAVFCVDLLRRIVQGEEVSYEKEIRHYVKEYHIITLTEDTVKGLYHWHQNDYQKGPFF